jgi:predicted nucleic acid-binding protein
LIVLDSYAWIEYFLGSDSGRIVKEYLDGEEAFTPSIVLAEVARKYLREGMDEEDVARRLIFIVSRSNILELDVQLSVLAAKAYLELLKTARGKKLKTPSLTDGIVLAAGRMLKAKIVTGDEHFKGLNETIFLA